VLQTPHRVMDNSSWHLRGWVCYELTGGSQNAV